MKTPIKCFPLAILIAFLSINSQIFAQVGIGTSTPNDNSLVDVSSTTKGFLPPRMTTTERNDLGTQLLITPDVNEKGMLVFDTTLTSYYYWDGAIWVGLDSSNYVDLTTMQTVGGEKTFTSDLIVNGSLMPEGRLMIPMGEISYFDFAGFTVNVTGLSAGALGNDNMVKINPTTGTIFVNDGLGTGTNSRLTYTGATTRYFHIALSFSYSPVNDNDAFVFAVAKNGDVKDSSKLFTTTGGELNYQSTAMHVLLSLAQNDYIEFWVGNISASGRDIRIKSFNFVAIGM